MATGCWTRCPAGGEPYFTPAMVIMVRLRVGVVTTAGKNGIAISALRENG
jgi:hypothetical protein